MKLFITNQAKFINDFPEDWNTIYSSHRQIHKEAFNILSQAIAQGNIPIVLMPDYKPDGMVIFDFKSFRNDVYFYEYNSTIS